MHGYQILITDSDTAFSVSVKYRAPIRYRVQIMMSKYFENCALSTFSVTDTPTNTTVTDIDLQPRYGYSHLGSDTTDTWYWYIPNDHPTEVPPVDDDQNHYYNSMN